MDFSRRQFMTWSALSALLGGFGISKAQGSSKQETFCYIDESGMPGTERPFVMGALQTLTPALHYADIKNIRKKHNYRLTLSYTSTDKNKIPYTKEILEYFCSKKLSFVAYVVKPELNRTWPADKTVSEIAYHHSYAKFIRKNWNRKSNLSLYMEKRTTTGEDIFLHNYLHQELGEKIKIKLLRDKDDDLMQLSDFLTGCVYAEITRPINEIKQTLLKDLKIKIGVKNLLEKPHKATGRFKVIVPHRLS